MFTTRVYHTCLPHVFTTRTEHIVKCIREVGDCQVRISVIGARVFLPGYFYTLKIPVIDLDLWDDDDHFYCPKTRRQMGHRSRA
jgi:hypothetical protein